MLEGDDIASLRREFAADLTAPRAVFEGLTQPASLLDRRQVFPGLVVARTVLTMQRIENAKLRLPRSIEDLQHMRNAPIGFCNTFETIPELASLGNEIVVRIDDEKCSDLVVKLQISHVFFRLFSSLRCALNRSVATAYATTQASFADAVNVAAFFLTNSCTLSGPCPVSVSTSSDIRS